MKRGPHRRLFCQTGTSNLRPERPEFPPVGATIKPASVADATPRTNEESEDFPAPPPAPKPPITRQSWKQQQVLISIMMSSVPKPHAHGQVRVADKRLQEPGILELDGDLPDK